MGTRTGVPRLLVETVLGWLLVAAGLVMLVTPGPGLVALLAGLAVLARHYRWADWAKTRTLVRVQDSATRLRAHRAARQATRAAHAPGADETPGAGEVPGTRPDVGPDPGPGGAAPGREVERDRPSTAA
jgi:hypothetical protein